MQSSNVLLCAVKHTVAHDFLCRQKWDTTPHFTLLCKRYVEPKTKQTLGVELNGCRTMDALRDLDPVNSAQCHLSTWS